MSRSGYVDDFDDGWALIRWRGAVASAIRGRRGQKFLKEAIAALDALPDQALIATDLQNQTGAVCFLGAVGCARGMDIGTLDPEDSESVAAAFGISDALAREIVYLNDEAAWHSETPEQRFARMRKWAEKAIAPKPEPAR
jgi:hypothetical protein